MDEVVIVSATRTALTNYGGSFRDVPVAKLASHVVTAVIERAGIDRNSVDAVVMGNVLQTSEAPNVARMAGIYSDIPPENFWGLTLNMQCGSGLDAINQCARLIQSGEITIGIAGGVEIMSRGPYVSYSHKWGRRIGNDVFFDYFDHTLQTVSTDKFGVITMSDTAENIANLHGISRRDQDEFAIRSHQRAVSAKNAGRFSKEIVPYELETKEKTVIDQDQRPRSDTTIEKISSLKPAFRADGTVTAANSSGINDGAAAVLMMSGMTAKKLGLKSLAKIKSFGLVGVAPSFMGLGPVNATKLALERANLQLDNIGLIELNEAFAAQALGCIRELNLNEERVNVNGGAIALGHPVGCIGTRIMVTLIHEMIRRNEQYGLATLCCGGGLGVATIIEQVRN